MTSDLWLGVLLAFGTASAILVVAVIGLRAAGLRRRQQRQFVCPVLGMPVDCELLQDVRTGQWKSVERCTAFPDPTWIHCEQDCAQLLNLGLWRDVPLRPGQAEAVPPA